MKNQIVFVLVFVFLVVACNQDKKKESKEDLQAIAAQNSEAYELLRNQCYICHSINSVSHDSIVAPPMPAIKMRYSMRYNTQEQFVAAVTKWVLNPTEDHALMRGAVAQFNVMPKLLYTEEDVKKIAAYIYENELEQPEWFDAHFKEMHGNGQGMGGGMGRMMTPMNE
jgi:cytochrome c1